MIPLWINFCYLVAPIFLGEFWLFFTIKGGAEKIPWTANCPMILHVTNEVTLWPLTSSKIIVLVAQPISTDGGPPAWAVDKRAELGWPNSRGKGWPPVCKLAHVVLRYVIRWENFLTYSSHWWHLHYYLLMTTILIWKFFNLEWMTLSSGHFSSKRHMTFI